MLKGRGKKGRMRLQGMVKTLTVLRPRKQIAKKMTQPWGKQEWCLQSASEIAWVRIERGHSLNRGHSPSKLYSNLIQSPPSSGTLRPVYGLSVLHRKKNTCFCWVGALELLIFIWFSIWLLNVQQDAEALELWGGGRRRGVSKAAV